MERITKAESNKTLREIPLFSELSIEQLREISAISSIRRFDKNELIFNEGDDYKGFFILLKGTVKIFKLTSAGKETVVHIIKPFTVFADIPLFEGTNYPVSAQAIEEGLALFLPKPGFLELLKKNQEISLRMLAGFAKRLKSLVSQLEDISTREVPNRLARYLLGEIKAAGNEKLAEPFVKLTIPKSTIAAYIGTITETLSRTFTKLQQEGIIRVKGKVIFISDIKKLKELAK